MKILSIGILLFFSIFQLYAQEYDFPTIYELKFRTGVTDYGIILSEENGVTHVLSEKLDEYHIESQKIFIKKAYPGKKVHYLLSTKQATQMTGYWLGKEGNHLAFLADSLGKVLVPKDMISSMTIIEEGEMRDNTLFSLSSKQVANPHNLNYLFSPTAYTLSKGNMQYTNAFIFGNGLTYGITDNLSATFGVEIFNPLSTSLQARRELQAPEFLTTIKYQHSINEKWQVAGGLFYMRSPFTLIARSPNIFGGFGVVTYGNPYNHISLGLVYAENGFTNLEPYLAASLGIGSSKRFTILVESYQIPYADLNWVWNSSNPQAFILTSGIRYTKNNSAFTGAVGVSFPLGLLTYSYRFDVNKSNFKNIFR